MSDHLIDQPVFHGFVGGHEVVALGVMFDHRKRLPGLFAHQAVEAVLNLENPLCMDLDIGRLPLRAAKRLVGS